MSKQDKRMNTQSGMEKPKEQLRRMLHQNEYTLDSMVQLFPGGIFVYSAEADEQFSFVSENMLAMLGYTKEEFIHKFDNRFSRMVYHEDRERVLREIDEQIAVGPFDTCYYRIEKKDGSLTWVHDEGHIVADENGKKWFYVVIVDITTSVQARENLACQYQQLNQILDHVPTNIMVLRKYNKQIHVIAVNQYLCQTTGMSEESFLYKNITDLLPACHHDDRESVRRFFLDELDETPTGEITYRIQLAKRQDYQWFHCNVVQVRQPDDSALVYAVYTDATEQKIKEEDYKRLINELLHANPDTLCAFRLNLSRNLCSESHGASQYINKLLASSTADGLLENISKMITTETEREKFRREFNRQKIMEQFLQGNDKLSTQYHRLIDVGQSHLVATYFHILRNPLTSDIETIAYSVDFEEPHKRALINKVITDEEYDYVGILDIASQKIAYYYIAEELRDTYRFKLRHEEHIRLVSEGIPSEQDRVQYFHMTELATILKALEQQPVYVITYFWNDETDDKRRKQLRFRYLEKDHKEIMFARTDVTATFQWEEKNTAMLQQALLDAEQANELKSEFLGNVSHDVRTPLNAILGYNKLALQAKEIAEKDGYLEKIRNAGETLLSLINDTLDLQKIENGTIILKPEVISCQRMIDDIVTAVTPMMTAKNIHFTVDSSRADMAAIVADPVRLRQIFINLLSNAAKFTPEGGHVTAIVECLAVDGNRIHGRIVVRDDGIGMSEDFLKKLYEPFSQERTMATAHIGGSGLGLSIVKRLVNLMGGRIEVQSKLGEGTQFTVYLDFEQQDKEMQEPVTESTESIAGIHILLCEDNKMNMEIAKTILTMSGAIVDCAANGQEGYEKFLRSQPGDYDIIFMDIRMPVMDGYTATRKIRESTHEEARSIPIFAMTADAYAGDVRKSKEAGMDEHIAKPIDFAALSRKISRVLYLKKASSGQNG